jgi:hypothetical protein
MLEVVAVVEAGHLHRGRAGSHIREQVADLERQLCAALFVPSLTASAFGVQSQVSRLRRRRDGLATHRLHRFSSFRRSVP